MTVKYTEEHEWIQLEDHEAAVVGITLHAQDALGDVVFVGRDGNLFVVLAQAFGRRGFWRVLLLHVDQWICEFIAAGDPALVGWTCGRACRLRRGLTCRSGCGVGCDSNVSYR